MIKLYIFHYNITFNSCCYLFFLITIFFKRCHYIEKRLKI